MAERGENVPQPLQGLTTAITLLHNQLGVSHSITKYDGNPKAFREWLKQIKKYAIISNADNDKVKLIAYQSSIGAVSDFIQRFLRANAESTWQQLKAEPHDLGHYRPPTRA